MAQATNKELLSQVRALEEKLTKVQASNSRTRDELAEMKNHYTNLVNGVNKRFEIIENAFRSQKQK